MNENNLSSNETTPIYINPEKKNPFCSILMKNCTIGHFINIAQVLFNYEKKTESKCISTIETDPQTGRQSNVSFPFLKQHPLYETYQDHLRSKTVIPILIGRPPTPPRPKPATLSSKWIDSAKKFAFYMQVLHRPWNHEDIKNPHFFTWSSFCVYMRELEFGFNNQELTLLQNVRGRWIENASHINRLPNGYQSINDKHRSQCATVWGKEDYTASIEPSPSTTENQDFKDQDSTNQAAIEIDLLYQETVMDDTIQPKNYKMLPYNKNTVFFLQKLHATLNNNDHY